MDMKICLVGDVLDVNMCAKFQNETFRGYDFTWDRIFHFPLDFWMGLTTVQRYCAACDGEPKWTISAIADRGNARRAMSVEILLVAAQLYEKSHLKRLAEGEWPWSLKVIANASVRQTIHHFLLVVYSNNNSMIHLPPFPRHYHIYSTRYVTGCDLENWEVVHFRKDSWNYKPSALSDSWVNIS